MVLLLSIILFSVHIFAHPFVSSVVWFSCLLWSSSPFFPFVTASLVFLIPFLFPSFFFSFSLHLFVHHSPSFFCHFVLSSLSPSVAMPSVCSFISQYSLCVCHPVSFASLILLSLLSHACLLCLVSAFLLSSQSATGRGSIHFQCMGCAEVRRNPVQRQWLEKRERQRRKEKKGSGVGKEGGNG